LLQNVEQILLIVLFCLAAVAFIGVLNARGLWRTILAALVALFCLGAALWHTAAYRAGRVTGGFSAPGSAASSGLPAPAQAALGTVDPSADADFADLLTTVRALRDSLAAEDPSQARALSDSEYQAFEIRAAGHLARARMLRERAARLATAPPSSGLEEAAEFLNQPGRRSGVWLPRRASSRKRAHRRTSRA
jgi:hypothetical protein